MKTFMKYALAMLLFIVANTAFAQDANKILDKTASTLKSAGNVKIGFTLTADGNTGNGYIKLQGRKFVVNMGGNISWFDGTTLWNYVKKNEEVNVVTPSQDEIAKMNPYAFLGFYKNGYTAKMGNSTANEYEVKLAGQQSSAYSSVVLRVNKSSYEPTYIRMVSSKGNTTEVRCNSFLKNQKYTDATFKFNKKNYPNAEVVDLR